MKYWLFATLLGVLFSVTVHAAETGKAVVIYENKGTTVGSATLVSAPPTELWITLADLKRATGFVNKPQGVCRDELCFPLPKKRRAEFLQTQGKTTWFNLTEFARLLKQPVARDEEQSTWYFGPRPDVQNSFTKSLTAPDFTLPDMNGKPHSLAQFRGKKVLLITWASW